MFCLAPPPAFTAFESPPQNLPAHEYLPYLQERIRQKRIALHKKDDPSIEYTVKDGILQFKSSKNIKSKILGWLQRGFSQDDVADILFTPQHMEHGPEWQQAVLARHEAHLLGIAEMAQKSLFDHAESPVSRLAVITAAVGVADVPLLFPYTRRAPGGGAVVIIPRALIIIPMWFAALRRLPRPWNEMPYTGEPLRRLLGTAGVAIKAMMGHTIVGTNTYMFELLHSQEMKIGLGGNEYEHTWVAAPELADFGKRHETKLCERFVIAHELAHVALGHHAMPFEQKNSQNVFERRRQAELEADHLALQVLLDLSPAARSTMNDLQHVFSGHQIVDALVALFLLFHVVEDHKAIAQSDSSHPPAEERLRRLIEAMIPETEGRRRFFSEIYPAMKQDQEVLDEMLGTAIALAKPKMVSHPDSKMSWL